MNLADLYRLAGSRRRCRTGPAPGAGPRCQEPGRSCTRLAWCWSARSARPNRWLAGRRRPLRRRQPALRLRLRGGASRRRSATRIRSVRLTTSFVAGRTIATRFRRRSSSIVTEVISPAHVTICSASRPSRPRRRQPRRPRPSLRAESARAIVNEEPFAWPDEVLRMRPAHLGVATGEIDRTRVLQIFAEALVG